MSDDTGGDERHSLGDEFPSIEELLDSLRETHSEEDNYRASFQDISLASQEMLAHIKGLERHYDHKGYWSYFLMLVMAFMVGFQSFLLVQVGFNYWDFSKYSYLLPLLLVQNLAQVVGLAVFVVKALFEKQK